MRHVLALALVAALPPLGAQQAAFHVANYDLTVDLPTTGNVIEGRAELTVVRTAPADTLVLDLLDLAVSHVTLDGRPVVFTQDCRARADPRGRRARRHPARAGGLRRTP